VIVVGLAMVYARIGRNPLLQGTLDGVAAAAIGLTLATGLRLVEWRPANIGPIAITLVTVL
jgi:chromate transport protein ChrA